MFAHIRSWLVSQSVGMWSYRLVEDHEESFHFAGPFQKWSGRITLLTILGFMISLFFLDRGQLRQSALALIFFVSVAHLLLMGWLYPVVQKLHRDEFDAWFVGHMKNSGWASAFSLAFFWFGK